MKKLLALLLCTGLLVGMIPASASAKTDLGPAYEALDKLNNAYAQLAGATIVKNAQDGFKSLAASFKPGSDANEMSNMMADWYAAIAEKTVYKIKLEDSGLSYEGLFMLELDPNKLTLGKDLYDSYYMYVGEAVAYDVRDMIRETAADIGASVSDIISSLG